MLITNASGGGFSLSNKRPDYQKDIIASDEYPGKYKRSRGIPDVAGHANISPNSIAYWIFLHGENWLTGGTSAVAPLWAALVARLNQALGKRIGFFNPLLYQMAGSSALKEITEGSNALPGGPPQWEAKPGWNPCTGLGVPHGENMLKWLKKNFK
jgi:kumamolisin